MSTFPCRFRSRCSNERLGQLAGDGVKYFNLNSRGLLSDPGLFVIVSISLAEVTFQCRPLPAAVSRWGAVLGPPHGRDMSAVTVALSSR